MTTLLFGLGFLLSIKLYYTSLPPSLPIKVHPSTLLPCTQHQHGAQRLIFRPQSQDIYTAAPLRQVNRKAQAPLGD